MNWASWVLIALFAINSIGGVAIIDKMPKGVNPKYTPGNAAFLVFLTGVSIFLLAVIGWNWATYILLVDFVVFMFIGLAKTGRIYKPVTKFRAIRNLSENIIEIALVIVGSLLVHHG